MDITTAFSFLVHPSKKDTTQPQIGGTTLPLQGNLFDMLNGVFNKAAHECNIDIAFLPQPDGKQYNVRRNDIIEILKQPTVSRVRLLAQHLQKVTTHRSGLGLLFVLIGTDATQKRIYISRFPADFGILAEENETALDVKLIERVFMRNAVSYKAVVYEGTNYDSDYWVGRAIDKQISNNSIAISDYWIREFLLSDFKTTSATGTRRLAIAIKDTIKNTDDIEIKEELSAAARLARSLNGQMMSMDNFGERFGLSEKTREALSTTLKDPKLSFTQFRFSSEEFGRHIRYRSLQINNGAVLTAPVDKFDDCFERKEVKGGREIEFVTRGQVINEQLRTSST